MQQCLDVVPTKVSNDQRRACSEQALSLAELSTSLHEMDGDKVSKLDGFPCEFYKVTWQFLGQDLLQV